MPPKRTIKEDNHATPSFPRSNPFSILDPAPQSPTEPWTRPPSPRVSTRPPTPQELQDIVLEIPSELATIKSRLQTFQQWPLTQITPRQLARLGFWHAPSSRDDDSVSCFACNVSIQGWRDVQHSTAELLALHDDYCIWADLLEDMEAFPNPPDELAGKHTTTSIMATKTSDLIGSPTNQPRLPTTKLQEPPQSQVPSQPQEPSHPQEPSTPASSPRKSYASVLREPPERLPQLATKLNSASRSPRPAAPETPTATAYRYPYTHSPTRSLTQSPTLTIDDLYNHFHNKPSPFTLTDTNHRRSAISQHKQVTAATNALSNFLLSALPAFTGFLSDIQNGGYNCRLPHTQKVSRGGRGYSQPKFSKRQWSTSCGLP
ncbi:hypothetical protein BDW75DRAFT_219522 [Aspergillus navahoensis]